jgi:hypothetical protein
MSSSAVLRSWCSTLALTLGLAGAAQAQAEGGLYIAGDGFSFKTAANGVLLVCQRDLDNGRLDAAALVPEVVAVRGWPSGGGGQASGERLLPGEDSAQLPSANEALRRLRSTCA